MREKSDAELLRQFAHERVESAFAEVVKRHVGLVYAVARRQVGGDAHLAHDVTQRVFTDLARKAASLSDREVLGGWLFRSAQFAASDVVRAERRRRMREQEAHAMEETNYDGSGAADWEQLRPVLDEAVGALGTRERDALVLRFFEGRPWADVGARLRVSEDAARMRVARALEKLRALLARRGITSTSGALGIALAQPLGAVPVGLATAVTAGAMSAAAGAFAGLGALGFMASIKLTVGLGGIAACAVGIAFLQYRSAQSAVAETVALREAQVGMRTRLGKFERDLAQATQHARSSDADNAALIQAIATARAANAGAVSPSAVRELTVEGVQASFKAGRDLAAAGKPAEALAELLWCFDEGMLRFATLGGVRVSALKTELQKLAQTFPPAAAALRERRDAAEKKTTEGPRDRQAARDFADLNQALGEGARTLALFDQLPAGDARRAYLATPSVIEQLVERQRYAEVNEVHPFDRMRSSLSSLMQIPNVTGRPDPEATLRSYRASVVQTAGRNFEVLVGAGDLKSARFLAEQVLTFDGSAETRALLERHATRAGKAGFVETLGK